MPQPLVQPGRRGLREASATGDGTGGEDSSNAEEDEVHSTHRRLVVEMGIRWVYRMLPGGKGEGAPGARWARAQGQEGRGRGRGVRVRYVRLDMLGFRVQEGMNWAARACACEMLCERSSGIPFICVVIVLECRSGRRRR